jgi:hypothetical protein
LTTSGLDDWATWSADNRWIAFQSARDGNPEIYLMTSSGQIQTWLGIFSRPGSTNLKIFKKPAKKHPMPHFCMGCL